jgi:hypothetical protein
VAERSNSSNSDIDKIVHDSSTVGSRLHCDSFSVDSFSAIFNRSRGFDSRGFVNAFFNSRSINPRINCRSYSTINIHTLTLTHTRSHTHTHTHYRRPGLTAICHSSEDGCFVIWTSRLIIIIIPCI